VGSHIMVSSCGRCCILGKGIRDGGSPLSCESLHLERKKPEGADGTGL